MEDKKGILLESSLDEVLHNSMMPYAEHVILDRALPRVEDGLKPVQRRILYTMYELGLTPDKPHRKCAKIIGDCLGKYHPHGDSSVYDALVRLAQDFNMRRPLVNGHGNFGTIDGDTAAAYRYTEARLEDLALELIKDIDKDTVDFSLNFDDTLYEPNTLPGKYPNLLVNGAYGIAVGLATNIPPHNLGEVIDGCCYFIDNPKAKLSDVMKYIKGPDFPTGGYVIAGEEMTAAYETGRGKIKIRAKINLESNGDKQSLIISEIPYQINKATLLKKIVDLKEEKKDTFAGIADVVDESDRNGMRAVIKLKKEANADRILANLFKYTDLETTFGINIVAIANGKPKQMGLLEILDYYVNYQREVILRRTKFDLEKAKERAHILEGLIIAVTNIDEVIKIIKKSANTTEARQNLRAKFELSEIQANAILDLRLARLTKLEVDKLKEELEGLHKLIKELTAIVGSKKLQMEVVKNEMLAIKKKYKDERRTKFMSEKETAKIEAVEEVKESVSVVFCCIQSGNVKKVPEKNFYLSSKAATQSSNLNDILQLYLPVQSDQTVLAFTNLGNAYKIDLEILPENKFKERGLKLTDVVKTALKTEKIVYLMPVTEQVKDGYLLFFTKQGYIRKAEYSEFTLQKGAYQAMKLKDGDEVIAVEEDIPDTTIVFVTKGGLCLNALKDDIPVQGRVSGGVHGVALSGKDEVLFVGQAYDSGEIVIVTSGGNYKRVLIVDVEPMARYRKGVKIADLSAGELVFAGYVQEPFDLAVADDEGMFTVNTEDIQIDGRTTKGKTLKNEFKKRKPVSVYKIAK